jgi:hypothetical protein
LDTDKESLISSDDEDSSKVKTRNAKGSNLTFDEESHINRLMNKIHDMSYITNDHDVMLNSSMMQLGTGDDSFFLTKKNLEGDKSPTKGAKGDGDIKPSSTINPIKNLNRIQKLRHMKGELIGANKITENENIDSIFNTETSLKRHISLSLYTRPKSLLDKRHSNNDYHDESFGSVSLRKRPQLRNGSVEHYQSNHSEQRTRQIEEIGSLKNQLTTQDINCSVMTIQRAILFPEDRPEEKRSYPKLENLLFHNPFEKKKKKKKGKKKRK